MNINDQIFYKAELLTKGMRASDNAKAILYKEFPDFFTKGIMHSLNVRFSETNCNVSIADDFAHESPYLLDEKDGNFFYYGRKKQFPRFVFRRAPTHRHGRRRLCKASLQGLRYDLAEQ